MPGWTVAMEMQNGTTVEASGDDYIMDLISDLETFPSLRDRMPIKVYFLRYGQEKEV